MKKITTILAVLFFGMFVAVGSAMAVPKLDFGVIAPADGTISYNGNDNPLVGSGISVSEVVGLDTVKNNESKLLLTNAFLNFETGDLIDTWKWGGGENTSITIKGTIEAKGDFEGIENDLLLTGSFGNAAIVYKDGVFHITGASFSDIKHPTLLEYYGLPTFLDDETTPYPYKGSFNISFEANVDFGEAFTSSKIYSGNIVNYPVPEPATMLFLGTSLLGLLVVSRRKIFKK